MKNIDRIKGLKNQLEHQNRQVQKLREENTLLHTTNTQIRQMTDAVIIELAKRYGERREDENGNLLGYRLTTTKVDVAAALAAFEIRVEDQGDDRVIGIISKEERNGTDG